MPEYFCAPCDYITSRKSNLDNHNKSSKHLKLCTEIIPTVVNNITEIDELKFKIKELEMQIQLKDQEIKFKNEMIELLKNKSFIEPTSQKQIINKPVDIPIQIPIVETEISNKLTKPKRDWTAFKTNKCVNNTNIYDFVNCIKYEYLKVDEYGILYLPDKLFELFGSIGNYEEYVVESFMNHIINANKYKLPIYCNDKLRRYLQYKNINSDWVEFPIKCEICSTCVKREFCMDTYEYVNKYNRCSYNCLSSIVQTIYNNIFSALAKSYLKFDNEQIKIMYSKIVEKIGNFDIVKCVKKLHSNLVLMTDIILFENKDNIKLPEGTYIKLNNNQEKFNYGEEDDIDGANINDDSLYE